MASLLNQPINTSYEGLVKTTDNAAITATPKALTDGAGNSLPVSVGTTSMVYSGTQDFSGSTVVGIGCGGAPAYCPGYVVNGGWQNTGDIIYFTSFAQPILLHQGTTLTEFWTSIHTAYGAGATANVYLYDTQLRTTAGASGIIYPYQKLHTIATGIPIDSTGYKTVTMSSSFSVTETGMYYVYFTTTTDGGFFNTTTDSFSDGNGWGKVIGNYNYINGTASYAGRHWFSGTSAGAPATLPADGTGINDMSPDPWFMFKYN